MSERLENALPLQDLLTSVVEVETPGNASIEDALKSIGYEMDSSKGEHGIIIWFHATYSIHLPRVTPRVRLLLTSDGLILDEKDRQEAKRYKLQSIGFNNTRNGIDFSFENLENPQERKMIKLFTELQKEETQIE